MKKIYINKNSAKLHVARFPEDANICRFGCFNSEQITLININGVLAEAARTYDQRRLRSIVALKIFAVSSKLHGSGLADE